MKRNYVLLPENYQYRPRAGYRRLHKKAYETFTPMSRAGRRVPVEGKVKMATAKNAKEDEEKHGSRLFQFVKKLNKNVAARSTYRSKSAEVNVAPVPVVTNQPSQLLWLDAGPASGFHVHTGIEARNYDNELEQIAIGCAYVGMGEPMEIDSESPNDYADLERIAVSCAYAGMEEPMDTTLDDTRGPIFNFAIQEQHVFNTPGFTGYFPPQLAQFELDAMLQPPAFQPSFFQAQVHHFVDQDQHLQPPVHAYPVVHQQFGQEDFVLNQIFPPVEANHYPVTEGHYAIAPGFDINHGHIHQNANVHVPLPPIVYEEHVDRGFTLYPPADEEIVNRLHAPRLVDERVGHNEGIAYQDVFQAGVETKEGDDTGLFEELFGAGDEDEEGDEEHDNNVDDAEVEGFLQSIGLPIPPNPS